MSSWEKNTVRPFAFVLSVDSCRKVLCFGTQSGESKMGRVVRASVENSFQARVLRFAIVSKEPYFGGQTIHAG
jgi:hypothetical protein